MLHAFRERLREAMDYAALQPAFREACPDAASRAVLEREFARIGRHVDCPHNNSHILTFVIEMFRFRQRFPQGECTFVEAGCYKGGSTAKFSRVARMLDARLLVCDSFEGIPDNAEAHEKSIFGYTINNWFRRGAFQGGLDEVRGNVRAHGVLDVCSFRKGWFEDTLPDLSLDLAGAYVDVDLASSTRTCIKYLYPRLLPGGFLVSQDGDFPLVIDAFDDDRFWETEVGCRKPLIHGLRKRKMLVVYKE